ncbi:MAG: hypothetical protein DRO11_01575 [Methanobacteriota archaeon]|nr:MAG: hypothetical protein DRO11_01575 [Euryarchaeota archaeon]
MEENTPSIEGLLKLLRGGTGVCLVACHPNADLDAVGSQIAIKWLLEKLGYQKVVLYSPEGPSHVAQRILEEAKVNVSSFPPVSRSDLLIVVDTGSLAQLAGFDVGGFPAKKKILIDHHEPDEELRGLLDHSYVWGQRDSYCSTSEIVFELIGRTGFSPPREVCLAMLAGIIADTVGLRHATPGTLRRVANLLDEGDLTLERVTQILSVEEQSLPRRIAHIKSAQRAVLERIDESIIVITRVSSFEGSSAKALINLGADVALVSSERGGKIRMSARASNSVVERGLNLGLVMKEIGRYIGGGGGGHAAAAGAVGEKGLEEAEKLFVGLVKEQLCER